MMNLSNNFNKLNSSIYTLKVVLFAVLDSKSENI